MSKGEYKIEKVIRDLSIPFYKQYSFKDCKNINKLKFDFYIPKYNCCIEYDGEQHFKPITFFGGEKQFNKQQQRDKVKNQYCLNNNINLIRIPYYDYDKIDREYLLKRIQNA